MKPCVLIHSILWCLAALPAAALDFEKEVLPVLETNCFECHGQKKQRSGLRVDSRPALLKGGDLGPALVPGDAHGSHLIELVSSTDDDLRMPPEGDGLSKAEIEILTKWIAQGAVWPGQMGAVTQEKISSNHWSFQPLATTFPHDSLDDFVRRKIAANGLQPSPQADPGTLIRRVTLDLTGLPPTPEEVEEFVQNRDANAYEKLITRLLDSPHYGERWAQHWLDVIRYADTRGYEYNSLRGNTWPYRDWVIDALNRDLPYDRFLFQQIAGDTVGVDPATGFLVTAPLPTPPEVGEEPTAIKAARFNALDEIVQNVGASMLGLTVSCARCHNHKFDPISAKDYYKMVSVFSGVQYESRPWRTNDQKLRIDALEKAEARISELRRELKQFPHWRESANGQYSDHFTPVKAKFVRLTVLATDEGNNGPAFDEIQIWAAERPGVAPLNIALTGRGAKVTSSGAAKQLGSKDEFLADGKTGKNSVWIAAKHPPVWIEFELKEGFDIERITWSRDLELFRQDPTRHKSRLATAWRIEVAGQPGEWRTLVHESRANELDVAAMNERRYLEEELDQLNASLATLKTGPEVFAGKFTAPELIHVLMRGDPQQPRDAVGPGALEVMNGFELPTNAPEPERRVAFAKWLVKEAAPLTARVAVNRVWHHHFGTGLVDTPGDFGTVGGPPTHPELLDWLATRLIAGGWSLKALHREILLSQTYRQSSHPVAEAMLADADTRLLWRFPPRRLDAEVIRDSMLAIAGTLDPKRGGEGVNLFTRQGSFDQWKPLPVPPPGANRRMIYLAKIRGADDGMFKIFDLPECGQVKDKRSESTTPLQALNLLNGAFTLDQSAALAQRVAQEAGADLSAQIIRAFHLALARSPSPNELAACLATAQSEDLTTVCRALFNSSEFLFLQ